MSLFSRFRTQVAKSFADIIASNLQRMSLYMEQKYGIQPKVKQEDLVKKYVGWIYSCTQISARAVASTPLRLYAARGTGQAKTKHFATLPVDKDRAEYLRTKASLQSLIVVKTAEQYEEVLVHPLLDLMQNVNENDNAFDTMNLTVTCLDLSGNGYWYLENGPLGIPTKLFVLRPQYTRIVPDKETLIKGYLYGINPLRRVALERDEVIHFKYPNPNNLWYGMGPVEAGAFAVERQKAMDIYEASMLRNMGRPDFTLTSKSGKFTKEQRKELEIQWNNAHRGPGKAGRMHVLDYDWDLKELGFKPREMEYLKGRTWTMKEICSLFPVPVGLVDTSEISKAPRAGMEGSDLFLAKNNTLPRTRLIEEKLNEQLTPRYDKRLFFAFDNPVPTDQRFLLLKETAELKNWKISINEARQRDGMEPVDWGDVPLVPMNIFPLGSPTPQTPEQEEPKSARGSKPSIGDGTGFPGGNYLDGGFVHKDLRGVAIRRNPSVR